LFWFISSALVLFFRIHTAKDNEFFVKILKDNLKLVLVLEYLMNFYTFSFGVEMVLLPITTFLIMLQTFADISSKKNEDNKKVALFLNYILGIFGLFVITYVIYKTICGYRSLLSVSTINEFLSPIILSILTIPYFYILALYMNYESLFISINRFFAKRSKQVKRRLKLQIIFYGNFSLKRIKKIWKKIGHAPYMDDNKLKEYIKNAAATSIHIRKRNTIVPKSSILLFNDIEKVREIVSSIGIGEVGEWDNNGMDDFSCMTNYFSFSFNPSEFPNNIACYLVGDEITISRLELTLSIHNSNEKIQAVQKFSEIVVKIFESLSIDIPRNLLVAISNEIEVKIEDEFYIATLKLEDCNVIDIWELVLESR
jgi:hypothetical protein